MKKNRNSEFESIIRIHVWQADIWGAVEAICKIPNSFLSHKNQKLKKQFIDKFRRDKENTRFKTKDPFVRGLLNIYQKYWRKVLSNELTNKKGEIYLAKEIKNLLDEFSITNKCGYILDSLEKIISKELKKRKLFHVLGCVLPLRELEIWKTENKKIYTVKLFGKIDKKVNVVFMEDFITNGWANYASFGLSCPGGWAKVKALYCVKKSYNVNSEKFRVSYLIHEAQHFCDYKRFPKLKQIDLEYRAKLAEIYSAKRTMVSFLKKFIDQNKKDRKIPHSFASYKLMQDLSLLVFGSKGIHENISDWKRKGLISIQSSALELYKRHSFSLNKAGAKSTKGVL